MVERYAKFTAAVSRISNCIQKIESEAMSKYGLTGACAQYIAAMRTSTEGLTVSQLSEVCMKDKAAVSRSVSQLEEKGLVCRNSQGGNVYRAPIVLTDSGKAIADYVAQRASVAVEIAGLNDGERQEMYSALDTIAKNLTDICKEGLPE